MGWDILNPGDPRIRSEIKGPDRLMQQKLEHFRRKDGGSTYKFLTIKVQDAAKTNVEVRIRYIVDQPFAFACFGDQVAAIQERPDTEWRALAMAALQKFSAAKDIDIKHGPHSEDTRPLNFKVELVRAVERSPESIAAEAQAAADMREFKIQEAMMNGDVATLREMGVFS